MRNILIIFVTILFSVFLYSCSSSKKTTTQTSSKKEITEKDRYKASDLFVKAIGARELGSLPSALDLLNQAGNFDPDDAAIHYEKARTLRALGRIDEALAESKTAIEIDPDNRWYKVLFADLSKENEKYDDYVYTYQELIKQYPNDLELLNEMAFAYYFTGDYKNAINSYDKIEEIVGISESLTMQKVQLYDRLNQPDGAIAEFEDLIDTDPTDPRFYALLAEYASKRKMDDKALWAYTKIVEINPNDPYVHISLADYYKKQGDSKKSFEELKLGLANPNLDLNTSINLLINYYTGDLTDEQQKQALELSEILKKTHPDDVMADSFYASMLFENKEYQKASDIFRAIVKVNTGNYAIWEKLLFCDLFLEQNQQLAADAEIVVDYFPTYPLPYYFAGISNFQLKDFVKAQAYLQSGIDFVVNNNNLLEQFYSSLGDTYHALENLAAAYEAYDKALSINPENIYVLNNYAYYLSLSSEKLDKAEKMSRKAVELDPYNSSFLDTHAWVLYQQKKYKEALEWIKKAYSNGGAESGVVLEHYGDILFQLGEKEEALNYWKLAKKQKDYSDLLDKKIKDQQLYE
ncbi:MAG TPA: tetratricopeptide repeat protein [Bacteroidales bacterium]